MRWLTAPLIVLFCSAACIGERPVISHAFQSFEQTAAFTQRFDLWVDGPDRWQLSFICPAGLTLDYQVWEGKGGGYESQVAEFEVNLGTLGIGRHCLEMEILMEGAQAVLGLPCAGEYWILPLNRPNVQIVKKEGQHIELTSEEWVLVESGMEVFFNGTRLEQKESKTASGFAGPNKAGGALRWVTQGLSLEAGEEREVILVLTGPFPAGELALFSGVDLALGNRWSLGNQLLTTKESQSNQTAILSLPALGPGDHRLRGFVRALLPAAANESFLRASLLGQEAVLALSIQRGWFDLSHVHFIEFEPENSVTTQPFLLPDGTLRYLGPNGRITVQSESLAAVIPLADPGHPLWVGVPLTESQIMLPQSGADTSQFILPVLVWDQDLSWRLIAKRDDWLVDLSAHHRQVLGKIGPLLLKATDGRVSLAHNLNYYGQANGWRWWEGPCGTGGAWRGESWSCTLEIPRKPHQGPYYSLQYEKEGVLARISRDDAVLSLKNGKLNCGVRWKTKGMWVQALSGVWRLDLSPSGIKFQVADGSLLNWSLQASPGQRWVFRLNSDRGEIYARGQGRQGGEWGVRFRMPAAAGARHALTTVAAQIKNRTPLFEIAHREGCRFSPRLALYVRGSVRGAGGDVRFNCGAGLVYTPVPQLTSNLDWDREQGWRFRAGVVIPFVRNME